MTFAGRRYVVRAGCTWLVVRLAFAMVSALAGGWDGPGAPLTIPLVVAAGVVALSATLGVIDVARRHEGALLANLGVSGPSLVACLVAPAMLGDCASALGGRVLAASG